MAKVRRKNETAKKKSRKFKNYIEICVFRVFWGMKKPPTWLSVGGGVLNKDSLIWQG